MTPTDPFSSEAVGLVLTACLDLGLWRNNAGL